MNVSELKQRLRGSSDWVPAPDMATIRRLGTRQRRIRRVGWIGVLAIVVLLGAVVIPAVQRAEADLGGPRPTPRPLVARALEEIDGAVRVSAWQVVVPEPAGAEPFGAEHIDPAEVGALVPTGTHAYTGVTAYESGTFPTWLRNGIFRWEHAQAESDPTGTSTSYPAATTDLGVNVDLGEAYLVCVHPSSQGGATRRSCQPAYVVRRGSAYELQWFFAGAGAHGPGEPLEMYSADNFSGGAPSTLWIGARAGTDAARVVYELADGTSVVAQLAPGIDGGDTIFFADVVGALARVKVYDDSGALLEGHQILPCIGVQDCEVR